MHSLKHTVVLWKPVYFLLKPKVYPPSRFFIKPVSSCFSETEALRDLAHVRIRCGKACEGARAHSLTSHRLILVDFRSCVNIISWLFVFLCLWLVLLGVSIFLVGFS